MAVLVSAALALLLLRGGHLLGVEWHRYRADPSRGELPTPEEAARDRWNAGVVMLVAGLSVIGALLAFWASSEFSSASGLSQQAVQDVTRYQTVKAEQDSYLQFGARLNVSYQEYSVGQSNLYAEAASAWDDNQPGEARALEAQARVDGAAERALIPGFVCYWPSSRGRGGSVYYDQAALRVSEVETPCVQPGQDPSSLRTLSTSQADALEHGAAADRSRAEDVILSGAFVIVAVFFLTVAYLGWRHRRARTLGAGVVAIGIALAVSALVGLS
jgi:hypothetical protein